MITDREAKKLAREPGVAIGPDAEVQAFEAVGSPPSLAAHPEKNKYHYTETGDGVIAYVIDSGVNTNHQEFDRSRATAGFDAFRASGTAQFGQDCNGHGTHVAGILGGRTFGVAKDVSIISVRVLDCNGSGSVSNVVTGSNHVTGRKNAARSTPMVANMSLGGSANSALDQAVFNSIAAGVTYSIAAGNGNIFGTGQDACRVSPARVKAALTVRPRTPPTSARRGPTGAPASTSMPRATTSSRRMAPPVAPARPGSRCPARRWRPRPRAAWLRCSSTSTGTLRPRR